MLKFKNWLNETLALKGNYKGNIFQRLVAGMYVLSPMQSEDAFPAFEDLKRKIARQSQFLSSKFQMNPTSDDPYPSMTAMTKDIERQRSQGIKKPVIPVYAEPPSLGGNTKGHPMLSNDDNVMQRGVHDIIAHYYGQHKFSARGEYGAYNRHLKTLCNVDQAKAGRCLAAQAMFTEVVAQTSYYYVYGGYAPQKAVLLPDFDYVNVGALNPNSQLNRYFAVQNKEIMKRPDFNWQAFSQQYSELAEELGNQGKKNQNLQPITPEEDQLQQQKMAA